MTTLIVVPDYASHYGPTSAYVRAHHGDDDVVVATGTAIRPLVRRDGWRWTELTMSAGSNAGLRPVTQPHDDLSAFVAATRGGMVPTLRHQAEARSHDLAWRMSDVAAATVDVVRRVRPQRVVVDHLAVASRIGLSTTSVEVTTLVPGHPSQLPVGDEVYGLAPAWPSWATPDPEAWAALRTVCLDVSRQIAAAATVVRSTLGAAGPPVDDAFGPLGATTVAFRYRPELHAPDRGPLPAGHRFVGDLVAAGTRDDAVDRWMEGGPYVYVSLGTFLGARTDVLREIAEALGHRCRLAVATGPTDPDALGLDRRIHLVERFLPQLQLLESTDAVVCHGGNNTVTEALAAGRPLVTLPLSTDQFAIAADLERTGLGATLDPNRLDPEQIRAALEECRTSPPRP